MADPSEKPTTVRSGGRGGGPPTGNRVSLVAAAVGVISVIVVVAALALAYPRQHQSPGDLSSMAPDTSVALSSPSPEPEPNIATPSASPLAIDLATATATTAAEASVEPCCSASPTTATAEEREISDRFWDAYLPQPNPFLLDYNFSSLADVTEQAHLIIRGRLTDFYVGEHWVFSEDEPASPLSYASVEIAEILKGAPVSRAGGTVEVQLSYVGEGWDPASARPLPGHDNLWFLMHEATVREQTGQPPRSYSEIAPFAYFIPSPQAVLRNIDGMVTVIGPEETTIHYGHEGFPMTLHGSEFDKLLQEVRQLAE